MFPEPLSCQLSFPLHMSNVEDSVTMVTEKASYPPVLYYAREVHAASSSWFSQSPSGIRMCNKDGGKLLLIVRCHLGPSMGTRLEGDEHCIWGFALMTWTRRKQLLVYIKLEIGRSKTSAVWENSPESKSALWIVYKVGLRGMSGISCIILALRTNHHECGWLN